MHVSLIRNIFSSLVITTTLFGCTAAPVKYAVRDQKVIGARNGAQLIAESVNAASARNSTASHGIKLRHVVAPVFPEEVRKKNIEGEVSVMIAVDPQGNVSDVTILQSPDPLLSEAVAIAMKQWKFEPKLKDGAPQAFNAKQTYVFVLGDNG